jgi:hypothetical protein
MAIDIEQAGAVIGFVHQMIVPDLVVQRGRFGHERQLQNEILCKRSSADTRKQTDVGAASGCGRKLRRRRGRKPPEEPAGQARAIVDHDELGGA